MLVLLGVLSLILLLPSVVVILLCHIEDAQEIEKKEMQKLISEALGN
jgi:hypothetical protein